MDIRGFFGNKNALLSDAATVTKSSDNNSTVKENGKSSVGPIKENIDSNQAIPTVTCNNNNNKDANNKFESFSESETIGNTTWRANESVPYAALVETFESVANLSGRLDKENAFCKLFKAVIKTSPNDLDAIVYLASNTLSPAYDGVELGIGDSLLVKAICEG